MKKIFMTFLPLFLSLTTFVQSVRIGDILCTDGSTVCTVDYPSSGKTAWGIVFYVDADDIHIWAVALHDHASSTQ